MNYQYMCKFNHQIWSLTLQKLNWTKNPFQNQTLLTKISQTKLNNIIFAYKKYRKVTMSNKTEINMKAELQN